MHNLVKNFLCFDFRLCVYIWKDISCVCYRVSTSITNFIDSNYFINFYVVFLNEVYSKQVYIC